MAALDPHRCRDNLVESVQQIYGLYAGLSEKTTEVGRSVLAEQTLVSLAVAFEMFISDLMVALICKEPDPYLRDLSEDMKKTLLNARYSHSQVQHLIPGLSKNPSANNLRQLVLGDGDNLAFPEARQLREFLTKKVSPGFMFEIDKEDEFFIDFLKAVRNSCAHHSQRSMLALNARLQQALQDPKVKDTQVCRALGQRSKLTTKNIGTYLKKRVQGPGQKTRMEYIANRIKEIAFKWVPG